MARGRGPLNWTDRYRYKNLDAFLSFENLTPGTPRSFLGSVALHF